jgi:hypothetical protein
MVARRMWSIVDARESAPCLLDRARIRGLSPRPISIAHLNTLPCVQMRPINPVVFRGSYSLLDGKSHLEVGLALRCFQRLSRPDVATRRMPLAGQPVHRRSVRSGPLVLRATPLKFPARAVDRDRTGSRRSEPSSRAALIRELRNPWDRVQPQDATSRHRGAKPCRRCERSGKISLLSPG